jgi:sugar phosphate isomerase/epimerase
MKLCAFADEAASDMKGQISALERNGISLLEIRGADGENISDITAAKAREIRKMLDSAGIYVWSVGSPIGKYPLSEPIAPHLDKFLHTAELAEILGAKRMRVFSFFTEAGADAEREKEAVLLRMRALLERAPAGLTLCHENEKGIYGDTAVRCEEIHRTFPQLKAVFDPANFIQCGQDTIEAWEKLAPYIEYMHIKDAMADGAVVPAGKGIGNLPFLLEKYKGNVLTLEPHLSVFDGFDKLESSEKTRMVYCYPTSRAAFAAAVNALKELI